MSLQTKSRRKNGLNFFKNIILKLYFVLRYKLEAKEEKDGVDRGELELSIVWRWSAEVAEKERLQKAKDDKSILKKMGKVMGSVSDAITGNVDDDDMDEAEEVTFLKLIYIFFTTLFFLLNYREVVQMTRHHQKLLNRQKSVRKKKKRK